ncbi:MAG: dTDP-4-dehydrorhamnose reductase [Rhodocyclaceae bacterium]|nr:dTDP-4-dehydrorhamnose reductase [Rhodocyclaceae bacterium]
MTTILLTGKDGQIGWELQRSLLPLGRVIACGRGELDLIDAEAVRRKLDELRPDVIVNAAAYTAVDKAESEAELAHVINAAAPALLADEAARRGALLIHYSTDYVYDGRKAAPYVEDDAVNPSAPTDAASWRARRGIQLSGADHLIFRTCWVYAARGGNFLRTILRLAAEREELRVVDDQVGAPTWARLVAEATAHALKQAMQERRDGNFESGVFHLAAAGEASWHGFASAIVAGRGGLRVKSVTQIATAEYPLPAARPANSRLNTDRLRARFGLELPDWETCLRLCLEEIP